MTTPQMPYPYTKGARIFLAPGAAERLARYQGLRIVLDDDGKPQKREKPKEPVTELEAQRIAVLPGGWLRAEIVFEEDVTPGTRKPHFVVDVLLPPQEVVAVLHGWFGHNAPGYGDYTDKAELAEWDASWGVTPAQTDSSTE
ncbi:hypothetical protein PP568_17300 [Mycobacteroides abscessus]|uniref:Uncharacterized protein n=1 Tax=Mycobacteroides abscessus subsp. abscessus TaxID=1185650 RepID=A0AB38CWU1_9MYCO|nr:MULTISPECIES: hypothetical protein [Mycobacteriaceae]MBE5420814.1 hypothetical protein [Mycobacteroides abscessus]MBN7434260.1 hypothetical protein [Mycobacteroides abscessus subsp. abscessus]MBN7462812.1 hypothetical protein [Mycobacteroides abscessus subsp. abscessus]MBN7557474.1 hypothetical protein [Mycobacteroides abscessus subsp. abscessus]MDM2406969.1 hypothetical protein [Mycobacteroides abscessus]